MLCEVPSSILKRNTTGGISASVGPTAGLSPAPPDPSPAPSCGAASERSNVKRPALSVVMSGTSSGGPTGSRGLIAP